MPHRLFHTGLKDTSMLLASLFLSWGTGLSAGQLSAGDPCLAVGSYQDLCKLAEEVSAQPHQPRATLPETLANLCYDEYQAIAYRPPHATWYGQSPTYFETFHRGFVQRDRVQIFTITDSETIAIPFSRDDFEYGGSLDADAVPDDLGHAGLKLFNTLEGTVGGQELLTFLGASYFRGRSGDTRYGTSARGLAINVALNQEEEFPCFRAFWVVRPCEHDPTVQILALLDSPSVAGAYRFRFHPGGQESRLEVQCELFFRSQPEKIALAPLTSMWMWGDGLPGPPQDRRPACHDSDGLLVRHQVDADQPAKEWTWRAFARQSYPSVSRIAVDKLAGFGLIQRNRAFYHFDDHNARYDLRPSVWVTPAKPWTDGHIELLELPGAHEGIDNIAAYWVPHEKLSQNRHLTLAYSVAFFAGDHKEQTYVGRATNLRLDRDQAKQTVELEIRFAGPAVAEMSADSSVQIATDALRAKVLTKRSERTETGDRLVFLTVQMLEDAPAELAVQLLDGTRVLSERFTYLCPPRTPEFVYPAVYTRQE